MDEFQVMFAGTGLLGPRLYKKNVGGVKRDTARVPRLDVAGPSFLHAEKNIATIAPLRSNNSLQLLFSGQLPFTKLEQRRQ